MKELEFITALRNLFLEQREKVSDIEMTSGNYDDGGKLIEGLIPTITTEFCEIGSYDNGVYMVCIVHSEDFSRDLFESIKDFSNVLIYGFNEFNTTLYPAPDFAYELFEKKSRQDKYLQIQFDFETLLPGIFAREYFKIKEVFSKKSQDVVNQLTTDVKKANH